MSSDEKKQYAWNNIGHQYFAAIIANLIMLGYGSILGWVSPVIPLLKSEDTPLSSGPLTSEQLSWIGSLTAIGSICGAYIFGSLASFLGHKRAMILLTFPSAISWFFIYFGDTYHYIYAARMLAGSTGGGAQALIIVYISEIANNNIRGRLCSFLYLSRNIGILFSYIIGSFIEYRYIPCICVLIQVVYITVFTCLPNTPQFHLQRHEFQKAENALKYYKGYKGESIQERMAFEKEFNQMKNRASNVIKTQEAKSCLNLKDLFERQALIGIGTGILLAFFAQFTGSFTFLSYAVLIFQKSGSAIDPYLSSIIMAIIQLFGNICTTQLADRVGRKCLIITSLFGSAAGLASLSLYSYLIHNGLDLTNFQWIPIVSLSFVIFIASVGIVSLVGVFTVENLPMKVRNIGMTISTSAMFLSAFMCTKYFPVLLEIIQLHGCLSIFATFSTVGAFFILYCLRETRGQCMDAENA